MMGSATGKRKKSKMSFEEAASRLAMVHRQVIEKAAEHSAASREAAAKVDAIMKPVHAMGQSLRGLRLFEASLQRIVDKGPQASDLERGTVENPERAGDLVAHQLADGEAAEKLVEENRFAGLVEVDIRLSTRIGGLSRIKERSEFQILAAARFRSDWDQGQIGGAKAIDYSQVRVDTSGSPADAVTAMGEDARRGYSAAVQRLGPIKSNLVQLVVCDNLSLRAIARKLGLPDSGPARESLKQSVLDAVDVLAKHYRMGPAAGRQKIRAEGERPTDWGGDQSGAVEESERAA